MRRKDHEVTGRQRIEEIMRACDVCRIAMIDGDRPYIVPMNFGYTWEEELPTLYFHSARQGRKIDILSVSNTVAFAMDCWHKLVPMQNACLYTYAYGCVMGEGEVEFVQDIERKKQAMQAIMRHQAGEQEYSFPPAALEKTALFALRVTSISGKRRDR